MSRRGLSTRLFEVLTTRATMQPGMQPINLSVQQKSLQHVQWLEAGGKRLLVKGTLSRSPVEYRPVTEQARQQQQAR